MISNKWYLQHWRVEGKGKKNKNWYFRAKLKRQLRFQCNSLSIGKMRKSELCYWDL